MLVHQVRKVKYLVQLVIKHVKLVMRVNIVQVLPLIQQLVYCVLKENIKVEMDKLRVWIAIQEKPNIYVENPTVPTAALEHSCHIHLQKTVYVISAQQEIIKTRSEVQIVKDAQVENGVTKKVSKTKNFVLIVSLVHILLRWVQNPLIHVLNVNPGKGTIN